MRTLTVPSDELASLGRLDAYFHLSDGRRLVRNSVDTALKRSRLGSTDGLKATVWAPARFKRVYAVAGEKELPYLRPSDTLNYVPRAADMLSATRSENIDSYRLRTGMILVTCSGRNLGPTVFVDAFMAQFVLSHDMIRVEIEDETLRFYILGLLGTQSGQQLLRKDKSGSVIDHITVEHVASLEVPMLADSMVADVAKRMRQAVQLRENARLGLAAQQQLYEAMLPTMPSTLGISRGWSIAARELTSRLDAAPYTPAIWSVQKLLKAKSGRPLGEIATALKPPGRYKTVYVDRANGVPILSGGQLLQVRPLNLRYMAARALNDINRYRLKPGWIAYQADGRSEEALGEPVMITSSRGNWLASGHVGRLVAKDAADAGRLYLAFQTPHAQVQLKALASGSVVDATFPADAEAVILPPLPVTGGPEVERYWEKFSEAELVENDVFATIEAGLTASWGSPRKQRDESNTAI
jgi:type I restriction enzyme S subunit